MYRDVGSRRREPDEEDFIEVKEFLLKPDAAILLCSDGLSDLLTSAEMLDVIEHYERDPAQVAEELVEAANMAGGNDNITAIFVAGSEFLGNASPAAAEARARNAVTKARDEALSEPKASGVFTKVGRALTTRVAFDLRICGQGIVLALALRWPKP